MESDTAPSAANLEAHENRLYQDCHGVPSSVEGLSSNTTFQPPFSIRSDRRIGRR